MEFKATYKGTFGAFRDILQEGENYFIQISQNDESDLVSVYTGQEQGHQLIDIPKRYLTVTSFLLDWDNLERLTNAGEDGE